MSITLTESFVGNDGSNYKITVVEGATTTVFLRDGIIRQLIEAIYSRASGSSSDLPGYRTRALTNANITLVVQTDYVYQRFTGTLTGAVAIAASTASPAALGSRFEISLVGVVVDGTNTLTIKSGSTTLLTYNTPSTLNGNITLVYNGTAWVVFQERVVETL